MTTTPLVDAHVVRGQKPYVPAEAARKIEIQLRKEIATLRRRLEAMESAISDVIRQDERDIGLAQYRIQWLREAKGDGRP